MLFCMLVTVLWRRSCAETDVRKTSDGGCGHDDFRCASGWVSIVEMLDFLASVRWKIVQRAVEWRRQSWLCNRCAWLNGCFRGLSVWRLAKESNVWSTKEFDYVNKLVCAVFVALVLVFRCLHDERQPHMRAAQLVSEKFVGQTQSAAATPRFVIPLNIYAF